MNASPFPLATVQRWMQAVVTHPEGAGPGLVSLEAEALIPAARAGHVVRERGGLSAEDRLDIYAGMYPLRMREALEGDYPALATYLGDEGFDALVSAYVAAHPSRSFTLARLGDLLPEFVATWGPRRRRELLFDVARLELLATRVFDAEEVTPLGPAAFDGVPPDSWPQLRLVPVPAFALAHVRRGAVEVLDATLERSPLPKRVGRGNAWVLYHRKSFSALRRTLDPAAGRLLSSLASGERLGSALEDAAGTARLGKPSPEDVSRLFSEWLGLGLFARIDPAGP